MKAFETQRMSMQDWTTSLRDPNQRASLAGDLKAMLSDTVLQHLPEPLHLSVGPNAVELWMKQRAAESDVMTIRDRADTTLLGLLILARFEEPGSLPTVHIGYFFSEATWGKGLGTELLAGLVDGYRNEGIPLRLLGGVATNNAASARILLKNGFSRDPDLSHGDTDMFSLTL